MSPRLDWQLVTKWTKRVGVALIVVLGIVGWSLAFSRGAEVDNLTTTQARNRPVTDYNVAHNAAQHCVGTYDQKTRADQDRFDADIAALLATDRSNTEGLQQAQAALALDKQALEADSVAELTVDRLCPEPSPPTFDPNGKVLTETVVRELHPAPASTG